MVGAAIDIGVVLGMDGAVAISVAVIMGGAMGMDAIVVICGTVGIEWSCDNQCCYGDILSHGNG